jgi:hypothetical protein
VQTTPGGAIGGCFVQIRSQSSIQLQVGYVLQATSDYPNVAPIFGSTINRFAVAPTGLDAGNRFGLLTKANIYARNFSLADSASYQYRSDCDFYFISQTFSCPFDRGSFEIQHVGIDPLGYTFQRMTTSHCLRGTTSCTNGGIAYNGTCYCPPYYTGVYCGTPICMNGGTLVPPANTSCQCPEGYGGSACQFDTCLPQIPVTFDMNGKSLVLIVEVTAQMTSAIAQLRTFIGPWIATLSVAHPGWFKNYVLLTFNSTGVSSVYSTADPDSYWRTFNDSTTITDTATSCIRPINAAITAALNDASVTPQNSIAWLITKAYASDTALVGDATVAIANSRAQLYYLVVDDTFQTCGVDPLNSTEVLPLLNLALRSGGGSFFLSTASFTTHLSSYLPTVYMSAVLYSGYNRSCPSGNRYYLTVDARMVDVYIDLFAYFGQLSVTDPRGDTILTQDIYSSPYNKLTKFQNNNVQSGIYTVSVVAPNGQCEVQIRGSTTLQLFAAYTQANPDDSGQHRDDGYYNAVANVNNNLFLGYVMGLSGIGQINYVEMIGYTTGTTILSPLYRRSNCSYPYYSGTFTCPDTSFFIAVTGFDEFGVTFRRIGFGFCVGDRPSTTAAPSTTAMTGSPESTTTGGLMSTSMTYADIGFDLVIAIDVSASMPIDALREITQSVKTLMLPFTIGQPQVRVSVYPVVGDMGFSVAIAFLNSIGAREQLTQALDDVADHYYDNSTGQRMERALADISSVDFMNQGYRPAPGMQNHLILYYTSTSTFTGTDPQAIAASIRSSKTYGIFTVLYRAPTVDAAPLISLSGGAACFIQANTLADLNNAAPAIRDKIWIGTITYGAYC